MVRLPSPSGDPEEVLVKILLNAVGVVLVVAGLAMLSVPVALIAAGVLVLFEVRA